ncbi:MAG: galactosyltransferase-related protein, partial [Thaumarchaeota archaeon]|nr:galactosyltransferase-related protein [Nitrososphaerota archaeon]
DILVNLDADNFAGDGCDEWIEQHFAANPKSFLWALMVKGEMTRGISGRIAVTAKAFLKVGGYDESKFDAWGPDDKDFNLRLQALGYVAVEIPRVFLNSVMHNNKLRFREYPHLRCREHDYYHMDKSCIESCVVNCGRIGLGWVFRNFDPHSFFQIEAIATRVFCIGLHKTATTSLHHAMEILGYDSWHWPSAHSAKIIWRQMNNEGYSRELERYDALSDLPIPMLYRKLDRAYPGSKFVFTSRDPEKWLDGLLRHYGYKTNKFRSNWDIDPFTHRIHKVLYGTKEFDRDRMLNRFTQHAAGVHEYFKDRPEDFYVHHNRWEGLCEFLGVEKPRVEYPRVYVKGDITEA